jgi:ABC-type polysaccharide/polyol phosphate export permease
MFPPEVLPVVVVLTNLMNYVFSLPILLLMLLIAKVPIGIALVALPAIMAVQLILILGGVFALSALNVQYRDVQPILQNLLTFWFFLCPILYPLANVPEKLKPLALASLM